MWNKLHFGEVKDRIKELTARLERLQSSTQTSLVLEEQGKVEANTLEMLTRETILWKEKAKSNCIMEGKIRDIFIYLPSSIGGIIPLRPLSSRILHGLWIGKLLGALLTTSTQSYSLPVIPHSLMIYKD